VRRWPRRLSLGSLLGTIPRASSKLLTHSIALRGANRERLERRVEMAEESVAGLVTRYDPPRLFSNY